MREIQIMPNDASQRLDRFLLKHFPKASASFIQKMIRQKKIKVNRHRASAQQELVEGDTVQLFIYEEILAPLEERRIPPRASLSLSYVFQNQEFAIIDKEAGVLSHAASPADYGNTVVDAFRSDLIQTGVYVPRMENSFTPALVHRLDRPTAGLVIGAKTHRALMELPKAMQEGRIEKSYLAYVEGQIDREQDIQLPLLTENGHSRVDLQGKRSQTLLKPVWNSARFSLVELTLKTGRTHQIRAHLSAIGHPLIGDLSYGARWQVRRFRRPLLLAYRLIFHDLSEFDLPLEFNVYSKQTEHFSSMREIIGGGKG